MIIDNITSHYLFLCNIADNSFLVMISIQRDDNSN